MSVESCLQLYYQLGRHTTPSIIRLAGRIRWSLLKKRSFLNNHNIRSLSSPSLHYPLLLFSFSPISLNYNSSPIIYSLFLLHFHSLRIPFATHLPTINSTVSTTSLLKMKKRQSIERKASRTIYPFILESLQESLGLKRSYRGSIFWSLFAFVSFVGSPCL